MHNLIAIHGKGGLQENIMRNPDCCFEEALSKAPNARREAMITLSRYIKILDKVIHQVTYGSTDSEHHSDDASPPLPPPPKNLFPPVSKNSLNFRMTPSHTNLDNKCIQISIRSINNNLITLRDPKHNIMTNKTDFFHHLETKGWKYAVNNIRKIGKAYLLGTTKGLNIIPIWRVSQILTQNEWAILTLNTTNPNNNTITSVYVHKKTGTIIERIKDILNRGQNRKYSKLQIVWISEHPNHTPESILYQLSKVLCEVHINTTNNISNHSTIMMDECITTRQWQTHYQNINLQLHNSLKLATHNHKHTRDNTKTDIQHMDKKSQK